MESKQISRHIDRLYLDPNNYRFIDNKNYVPVDDMDVLDERIQQRTYNLLAGKNEANIQDLITSFKANGVLKLDPIQVKRINDKDFLVVEGNRRTAALKFLYDEYKASNDVGKLTLESFKSIEIILITDESPVQHLITMGLHHISGKKKWSPINQARLIHDLRYNYNQTEKQICDSLSITKNNLKRSLRVLALIEAYLESDYGDQFNSNMYSIFEEIIKKIEIKAWLEWNDAELRCVNEVNQEKLFSWISQDESIERPESGDEQVIIKEPIITKSHEIRDLAKFVNDEKALAKMEESRSISEGFALSDAVGESRLQNAINNITKEVNTAFQFSEYISNEEYQNIGNLRDKLDRLIPSSRGILNTNETLASLYYPTVQKHFEILEIKSYRKLRNVITPNLGKVNLFVGTNNSGKTSILEAFYLTTQLNNIQAFLNLEKFRGRFLNEFHSRWIDRNFLSNIRIEGSFNSSNVSVSVDKFQTEETNINKSNYISSIRSSAVINDDGYRTTLHLFSDKESEIYYQKNKVLCNAAFSSPYRKNPELLEKAHAKAIEEKYFPEILEFIRQHLDSSIENIEMVKLDGEARFMVSTFTEEKAIDLTKYGEGLQRIFEIAILISYSQNGIICIDEIDSAIHKNLLIAFTKYIQQLAEKFNVQIFLSTHSKECIDAFFQNEFQNDQITAYILNSENGKPTCKWVQGKRLERLLENANIDIR